MEDSTTRGATAKRILELLATGQASTVELALAMPSFNRGTISGACTKLERNRQIVCIGHKDGSRLFAMREAVEKQMREPEAKPAKNGTTTQEMELPTSKLPKAVSEVIAVLTPLNPNERERVLEAVRLLMGGSLK